MPGWLTATEVANHVEVVGVDGTSVPLISSTAAAVAWVETKARPDLSWTDPAFVLTPDVKLGTMMLAWRWYERRASPLGVVTSPTGDPVEILRNDPDIARLLGVASGTEGPFVFGAGPIGGVGSPVYGDEIGFTPDGRPYLLP